MTAALAAVLLLATGSGPILTLDEAVSLARQGQPALRQARAATRVAEARRGEALAGFLPRLDANLWYQRLSINLPSLTETWDSTGRLTASATASMVVWDFGATLGRYQSASALATSQLASERATTAQVLMTSGRRLC